MLSTKLKLISKDCVIFTNNEHSLLTRAKENMRFKRMYSNPVDKATGVRYDQIVKLETYYSSRDYPEKLRRVEYHDCDSGKELIFLTNNMELNPTEIAYLYKKRWEAKLYFK